MQPIHHETRTITLANGTNIDVRLYIHVEHDSDSDPMDQHFETPAQAEEFRRKLITGYYEHLLIRVRAVYGELGGTDYLGGCIVHNTSDIFEIVEQYGMKEVALTNLTNSLNDLAKILA